MRLQLLKLASSFSNLLNGKPSPSKLEPLHFNCLALHLDSATLPPHDTHNPSQSGGVNVGEHPAASLL